MQISVHMMYGHDCRMPSFKTNISHGNRMRFICYYILNLGHFAFASISDEHEDFLAFSVAYFINANYMRNADAYINYMIFFH